MSLYRIVNSELGKDLCVSTEDLESGQFDAYVLDGDGALARPLVIFEEVNNCFVRLTRSDFASRFKVECESYEDSGEVLAS
jgi:hypothetical protein